MAGEANNYTSREKQGFEKALQKVLDIRKNLENDFYLTKPSSEIGNLIISEIIPVLSLPPAQ